MQNVIRAFVVVLVLTGAAASTQIALASSSSSIKVTAAKTSVCPIPMCDPNDANACGIDKW